MSKLYRAIGLMSGTSMDAIDCAVIETDGYNSVRPLTFSSVTYDEAFRLAMRQALADAAHLTDRTARTGCLGDVERELTTRHAGAVKAVLADSGLDVAAIDLIGFHGQTVLHRPERQLTIQIGDGPGLAALTGKPVVFDMRANDVARGGEGAPLAPAYHRALVAGIAERPVAVLNIGGVANVTWIGPDDALLAFDTGPGNALIDDWMLSHTGQARDDDGAAAASGLVDDAVLGRLLEHAYFSKPPPKSLDRNDFTTAGVAHLSVADGAATLAAFTAHAIGKALEHMPQHPALWVVCGGGRRNQTLMTMIADAVAGPVAAAEAHGFDGDAVEAEAWAYLAVRSVAGEPLTYPGTTGVAEPTCGGIFVHPQ